MNTLPLRICPLSCWRRKACDEVVITMVAAADQPDWAFSVID